MPKTKCKNQNKNNKLKSEEFELPISLEELAMNCIAEGEPTSEIIKILRKQPDKVNEVVKNILTDMKEIKKWKVTIQSVKLDYYDSNNITHGVAYFSVHLKGSHGSLKKISRSDWPFTQKDE